MLKLRISMPAAGGAGRAGAISRRLAASLLGGVLAVGLTACGSRSDEFPCCETAPRTSSSPQDQPSPGSSPATFAPTPVPTWAPRPAPTPPATGSVLLGTLGGGDLVDPRGIACGGGTLFVADAPRHGLLGVHGAVLGFDAAAGKRLGTYEATTASTSLPVDLTAVAVSTVSVPFHTAPEFVYPVARRAVFGFVAERLFALNFGEPYAPGGADAAISGARAWVAESGAIRAYTLPYWLPDASVQDVAVSGAKGVAADETGQAWSVSAGQILQGQTAFTPVSEPPGDPRDVAIDLRDGAVAVLDRDRVLRYARDGAFLGATGAGVLRDGRSLAIGADGSLYICDGAERRVFRFAPP